MKALLVPRCGILNKTTITTVSGNVHIPLIRHISTDYFYDQSVDKWAIKESNRMSLKEYCAWGKVMSKRKLILSGRYVQKELGIRLAREIQNFHELPYTVMCSPHVKTVFDMYLTAFQKITGIPEIDSDELEVEFSKTLEGLVHSYKGIVDLLASGIYEASRLGRVPTESLNVQHFLDRFIINRIARRVLAEQHLVLRSNPNDPDKIGVISAQCEIMKCISEAKRMVLEDAKRNYNGCPDIIVKGDISATIPYVDQHLVYILVELFSNSVNAIVKIHKEKYPPIQVLMANGNKTITLRISDSGGGIPPFCKNKIFEYGWTTAKTPKERIRTDPMGMKGVTEVEPVGLGFGLPLARLYAKHFGGNLTLESLDGYGTDVFLTLDKTGDVLESFEL